LIIQLRVNADGAFFEDVGKLGGGYLGYIPKPFNFEYLSELIETGNSAE